jgi:RNA-binding protein
VILTTKEKQKLKGYAHSLRPIVSIGRNGLTEAVNKEVYRALNDHELIKMRIQHEDRAVRRELFAEVSKIHHAELIQVIGCIGVLYRKNPEKS